MIFKTKFRPFEKVKIVALDTPGTVVTIILRGNTLWYTVDYWWNLEEYQQIIERIGPTRQMQAGHNRPVFIYNIRAEGTIDATVIQSRTDKRQVQDLLLEAAKR